MPRKAASSAASSGKKKGAASGTSSLSASSRSNSTLHLGTSSSQPGDHILDDEEEDDEADQSAVTASRTARSKAEKKKGKKGVVKASTKKQAGNGKSSSQGDDIDQLLSPPAGGPLGARDLNSPGKEKKKRGKGARKGKAGQADENTAVGWDSTDDESQEPASSELSEEHIQAILANFDAEGEQSIHPFPFLLADQPINTQPQRTFAASRRSLTFH